MDLSDMAQLDNLEVVDDSSTFFAPVASDLVDGLVGQYQAERARIAHVAAFVNEAVNGSVLHYFLEGNRSEDRGRHSLQLGAQQLFQEAGAVGALNSTYWSKALSLTDVREMMPQKRRTEWDTQILEQKCPDFEEETVRSTLMGLLNMRAQFFGERVDGIFRGLSGEHVTNAPEAFGKRMIVAHVLSDYGTTNHNVCGLISDLRCVIAKFMGREEPGWRLTEHLVRGLCGRWGEWVPVDGGALRIRLYKKGTAHLEVHPDMAWRLNGVLASLYPAAIPAQFRQRPKKRSKDFDMLRRPLPARVLEVLADAKAARERVGTGWPERYRTVPQSLALPYGSKGAAAWDEAARVLESLGGVRQPGGWFEFDYAPEDVMQDLIASGCLPDRVAHQFFWSPPAVVAKCEEMARLDLDGENLEPSAGHGHLAAFLPKERTTCVEISPLHCAILRAKGFDTEQADFLQWAPQAAAAGRRFDRVVMNPPFSDGRALAHVEAAATLLRHGGRLVAVLPASMRGQDLVPGFGCEWSEVIAGAFAHTSAAVAVVALTLR